MDNAFGNRMTTITRRNTIGNAGSPFNYRRPRLLQSIPLRNRNHNDSSFNADMSTINGNPPSGITKNEASFSINERSDNTGSGDTFRRPLIFGRENTENHGKNVLALTIFISLIIYFRKSKRFLHTSAKYSYEQRFWYSFIFNN